MVDPVAFSLGSITVHWYGVIIAAAVAVGLPWAVQRARTRGLDARQAEYALWLAIAGGLVGARLGYVVQNLGYFTANPIEIVALTGGGLSIHGMLAGGLIAGAVAAHRLTLNFWRLADAATLPMLAGMILGRLGNFTNAELFGPPTDLPWGIFIPVASRPPGLQELTTYHPTFAYDMALNALLLVALIWMQPRARRPGALTLWMLIGVALTRFVVEFWRIGEVLPIGLTLAQCVSLLILAGAGWAVLRPTLPTQGRS